MDSPMNIRVDPAAGHKLYDSLLEIVKEGTYPWHVTHYASLAKVYVVPSARKSTVIQGVPPALSRSVELSSESPDIPKITVTGMPPVTHTQNSSGDVTMPAAVLPTPAPQVLKPPEGEDWDRDLEGGQNPGFQLDVGSPGREPGCTERLKTSRCYCCPAASHSSGH